MRTCLALFLAAAAVVFSSCGDPEVTSYRVPKEAPEPLPPVLTGAAAPSNTSAAPRGGDMASTAVPTAGGDGLTWTAPAHWKAKASSAMRKGSYAVSGPGGEADMSVTAFPGDVGGTLANVNRWRGQLELPPMTEGDLGSVMQHLDIGDFHVDVVEFANAQSGNPQRMIGAIVPFEGSTWFFKLTGPDALVAQERAAFLSLVQSIKPPASTTR